MCAQDRDPTALAASLDALHFDDAGKFDSLLSTHGWLEMESVHANRESALESRERQGWPEEVAAALPVILIESLARRGLQGEVRDKWINIAEKSAKTAIVKALRSNEVHACMYVRSLARAM